MRVAIVVGILAAAFVIALFGTRALPGLAMRLIGQAPDGLARYGGIVGMGPDGTSVEIPKIRESDAAEVIAQLKPGGVGLRILAARSASRHARASRANER